MLKDGITLTTNDDMARHDVKELECFGHPGKLHQHYRLPYLQRPGVGGAGGGAVGAGGGSGGSAGRAGGDMNDED